jgi:hypothetical protein
VSDLDDAEILSVRDLSGFNAAPISTISSWPSDKLTIGGAYLVAPGDLASAERPGNGERGTSASLRRIAERMNLRRYNKTLRLVRDVKSIR